MTSKTDSELVALYAAGGAEGESAFAEIVRRHGALVFAACRRLLGDAAAEDAVQAVFMLLARKARTLSRREALAGWLYGAAMLVAREGLRSARRRERAEEEGAAMREAARRAPAGPEWSQLRPELDAALSALPRQYRDAVLLSCAEGRPEKEVARELGVPPGTVKSRVSRGLERLRERLGQRGVISSVAALGGLLGAHGAEAMPAALAAKVTVLGKAGAAAAAGTAAGSASLAMMEGAMKAMFWVKLKLAAAVIGTAVVLGGGGGLVAVQLAAGEPVKAGPAEGGKVAWGEAVNGLRAGLVPLGGVAAKDWPMPFLCVKCQEFNRMLVRSKCEDCGAECSSNRKLRLCPACAAKKRVCQACLAAKPSGAAFAEGEPLAFEIHMNNPGSADLTLRDAGYVANWLLDFKSAAGNRTFRPQAMFDDSRAGPEDVTLNKGRSTAMIRILAAPGWKFRADGAPGAVDALPPGKYTVTASYEHVDPPAAKRAEPCPYWHGKVATGAVEIEIKAKGEAAGAGEWQKLFADEGWYKNQAGAEQVYTGTLEGVPAGGPSTLQRNSYYKLGDRTLYTGARKLPALDALVGKKVEVRGKPVDMALEGREVSEIWPAAVRAAR